MENLQKGGIAQEQKKMINKMKYDLESWREIILFVKSILLWRRQFYPGIIFGTITIGFLILWHFNFSILTLISLTILLYTFVDYAMPIIGKILFRSSSWTGIQEKEFEEICTEIHLIKMKAIGWYSYMFTQKEDKSPMFYLATCLTLIILAYIGAVVDNLLLSYIAALSIAFYPGLIQQGFIYGIKNKIVTFLSSNFNGMVKKSK